MVKIVYIAGVSFLAASFSMLRWTESAPLLAPLAGGYGFTHSRGIVYAGGSTWLDGVKEYRAQVQLYDAGSNRWSRIPSLPMPLAYGAGVATSQGLEILGGVNASGVVRQSLRLELSTMIWQVSGSLPVATLLSRAEAIGDEIFLFGGCSDLADLTGCSDAVWMRNRGGKWNRVASLPQGALAVAASAVAGKSIYLFGGCSMRSGVVVNHDEAWRFDAGTHQWRPIHALPRPTRGMAAVAIDDRYILLAGGYVSADYGFSADALIYDAVVDRYSAAASLPIGVANVALVRSGSRILAIGGEDRMKSRTPRVFVARTD